jgi:hypothetical protein
MRRDETRRIEQLRAVGGRLPGKQVESYSRLMRRDGTRRIEYPLDSLGMACLGPVQ